MSIFKCKMCGGTIEFEPGATVGVCDSCGTKQTLPKLDDDRRANLYDRANHFRRNNEFDKAAGIYERILTEDTSDAEAYWSLVLCRYGIEYVEDPATHRRVPTVNRAQYTSVFDDDNYKSALHYADSLQRILYEQEAVEINEIQKGILAISQKEKPFDVFICYKETDQQGRRTQDSVLANDLYHQLTQEGFKVFFSRITLEDKLGTAYEPYIFAALNSARVMVVLGTRPEHFNAVWVKNEWSRYLALVRDSGGKKVLIPAYRDMDPYDLPEEFSHLQAQDMSKLGFMQDLIRGIKKLLDADKPQPTARETVVVQNETNSNVTALLKRGNMALEDREWEKADDFFEQVLNQDAECAEAYLGKLLAKEKRATLDDYVQKFSARPDVKSETLYACEEDTQRINDAVERYTIPSLLDVSGIKELYEFDRSYQSFVQPLENKKKFILQSIRSEKLYQRAVSFAKGTTAEKIREVPQSIEDALNGYIHQEEENDRKNQERISAEYAQLIDEADRKVAALYESAAAKREETYQDACQKQQNLSSVEDYDAVIKSFQHPCLAGYKDSAERIETCKKKKMEIILAQGEAENRRLKEEKNKREQKTKTIKTALLVAVALVVVGVLVATKIIIPNAKIREADKLIESGQYDQACVILEELGKEDEANDARYTQAQSLLKAEQYDQAYQILESLGKDDEVTASKYDRAVALEKAGDTVGAKELFFSILSYQDSKEHLRSLLGSTISSGGDHTVGVRADGTVVATGDNEHGQCNVSKWKDIVAVSAGDDYTVGLRADGTVVAAGSNVYGECDVSDWKDIIAVSAGGNCTVGLHADGTVVAVGYEMYDQCNVSDWEDIVAIASCPSKTFGIRSSRTVVLAGSTSSSEKRFLQSAGSGDTVAVDAGWNHIVYLRADGTVVAGGGDNESGACNVSTWRDIVAVSAGFAHTVGLQKDGTVVAVGNNKEGECNVSKWKDIVAVSAGWSHTVGLRSDGTAVAVGNNEKGQCNVSKWKDMKVPNR